MSLVRCGCVGVVCAALLSYLAMTEILEVITTIAPIITQPETVNEGFVITFGDALGPWDRLSEPVGAVGATIVEAPSMGRDTSNRTLIKVGPMKVQLAPNTTYEVAAQLAGSLTDIWIETGACKKGDVRRCAPLTETTKNTVRMLQNELKVKCRDSGLSLDKVFQDCLKLDDSVAGVYLSLASMTYEHGTDCVYESLNVRPWSIHTGRLEKLHRKVMTTYTIVCSKDHPLQIANGFVTRKRTEMRQSDEDMLEQYMRCANGFSKPGIWKKWNRWHGSAEIGIFALVTWCKGMSYDAKECWEETTSLMGPIQGRGTNSMDGWSKPELFDMGQEVVRHAYEGTLDFQQAWYRYSRAADRLGAPSESFRSTFSWGYDIESRVLGPANFKTIQDALGRTGLLPPEVHHSADWECVDPDTDEVYFVVPEVHGSIRRVGFVYTVPWLLKLPNMLVVPLQMACTLGLPVWAGQSARRHSVLGVATLLVTAATWPFATAVSSNYAGACELRVQALFGSPAQVLVLQTLERCSIGSTGALLTQSVLWTLSNLGVLNTGHAPARVNAAFLGLGILVAFGIGLACIVSPISCNAEYPLRTLDVFGPLALALVVFPFLMRGYQKVHIEGRTKRVLWRKLDFREVSDGHTGLALGLRLFGRDLFLTVKAGVSVMKSHGGDKIIIEDDPTFQGGPTPDSALMRAVKFMICERSSQPQAVYEQLVGTLRLSRERRSTSSRGEAEDIPQDPQADGVMEHAFQPDGDSDVDGHGPYIQGDELHL